MPDQVWHTRGRSGIFFCRPPGLSGNHPGRRRRGNRPAMAGAMDPGGGRARIRHLRPCMPRGGDFPGLIQLAPCPPSTAHQSRKMETEE